MSDHVPESFESKRGLARNLLLQALLSLDNISQLSSNPPRDPASLQEVIGEALRDKESVANEARKIIQSLRDLNEQVFGNDFGAWGGSGLINGFPGLGSKGIEDTTPPPEKELWGSSDGSSVHTADEGTDSLTSIPESHERLSQPYVCNSGSSLPGGFSETTCQVLTSHATSPLLVPISQLLRAIRTLVEIRHYTLPSAIPIPQNLILLLSSIESTFSIVRSPETDSIWNTSHQEQRFEVFSPRDHGSRYRLKCVCPKGALHSLDVYCPRNSVIECDSSDDEEKNSEEYNRRKSQKTNSPEGSVADSSDDEDDEDDENDGRTEAERQRDYLLQEERSMALEEERRMAERRRAKWGRREREVRGIMEMVGWKGAKEHVRKLEGMREIAARQGVSINGENFGTVLMGGSGTGKTTFAHKYAAYLWHTGLVSCSNVKTTTGIYLANGGISRLQSYIDQFSSVGGVFFIDDAHFLLSGSHRSDGVKVLDYLLQIIPLHKQIVFVLAGSEKGMMKILGHGGCSEKRLFPYTVKFEGFTDEELVGIFEGLVEKRWEGKMRVQGGVRGLHVRVAIRRVGREGKLGSAWSVERLVGRIWERFVVRRGLEKQAEEKNATSDAADVAAAEDDLQPTRYSYSEYLQRIGSTTLPIAIQINNPTKAASENSESADMATGKSENATNDEGKTPQEPKPDYYITKEDILGPDPSDAILNSPAWQKLQKLTGLEEVKNSILSLLELVKANYQREMEEKPLLKVCLNRLFLGPPGTGKTLVAKLYGQILAEIGLLSKGEVLLRNPSDLIGKYIGYSEANTKSALNAAVGNVLVIDEAYMMYSGGSDGTGNESDSYRQGIIDTLVGEIQSEPGENRCVLLLGYEKEMEEMLQNSNPGLARRFPLADAFRFQNFTVQELESILRSKLQDHVLEATEEAIKVAMDVLEKASQRANFGNGGDVENLISKAKMNYHARMSQLPTTTSKPETWTLLPQDFDPFFERGKSATTNLRKLFTDVVGCETMIHKFETYQRVALGMKTKGLDPRPYIPTNFIFKGPPGTGKTTTARKLATIYYDMGFLSEASVVECSASDLVGKYIGHSGPKTVKVFEKALGKVLFIDEAYRLLDSGGGGKGGFGSEVVGELCDLLTKEKYRGKIVVVVAGYEDEMERLMEGNPGLKSRFPEEMLFEGLSAGVCLEILGMNIRRAGIEMGDLGEGCIEVERVMGELVKTKGWGNARDVETLAKGVCREVFSRLADGGELVCTADIVLGALRGMLAERKKSSNKTTTPAEHVWANGMDEPRMLGLVMKDQRNGYKKAEKTSDDSRFEEVSD